MDSSEATTLVKFFEKTAACHFASEGGMTAADIDAIRRARGQRLLRFVEARIAKLAEGVALPRATVSTRMPVFEMNLRFGL